MSLVNQVRPPPVIWAQRPNVVYVTICLEDCIKPEIEVNPDKIYFKGVGGTDKNEHEVTIHLFKEIDPEKTIKNQNGRNFEFTLVKKENGPYWPRLTKESKKYHWLKIDFGRWKDEDDSGEEDMADGAGNMDQMMQSMLGMQSQKDSFDDLEDEADSDDEDIPPLE